MREKLAGIADFFRRIGSGSAQVATRVLRSERLHAFLRTCWILLARSALRYGYPLRRMYWYMAHPETEAAQCFVEYKGQVLLVRNTYGSRNWCLPGGYVEKGERPDAAAIRETAEETGIILPRVYRIGCYLHEPQHKNERMHVYYGETEGREIVTDPIEIKEAAWFPLSRLPVPLAGTVEEAMAYRERFLSAATLELKGK